MASAGKVRMGRGVIGLVDATKRLDHRANLDVLSYPVNRSSREGGYHSGGARKCWVRAGFTRCRWHDALCNQWYRHLAQLRLASASPVRVDAHNASPRAMNDTDNIQASGNSVIAAAAISRPLTIAFCSSEFFIRSHPGG